MPLTFRCQFHQHFTRSFYSPRSQKRRNESQVISHFTSSFYAGRPQKHKNCSSCQSFCAFGIFKCKIFMKLNPGQVLISSTFYACLLRQYFCAKRLQSQNVTFPHYSRGFDLQPRVPKLLCKCDITKQTLFIQTGLESVVFS